MARVGFSRSYAAGAFDGAAVQALFGDIKTYLFGAGFDVVINEAEAVDVIRKGTPAGTVDDDVPHWALTLSGKSGNATIKAVAVHGVNYLDANARAANELSIVDNTYVQSALTVLFAADGVAGWWWLHGLADFEYSATGKMRVFGAIGATTRRYSVDRYQGLASRYGILDPNGGFYPAYAMGKSGTITAMPSLNIWSPFGGGGQFNAQRHPGSPLPRMAVPAFPSRQDDSACIYGEFNEFMVITDGYVHEEIVMPGWIALACADFQQPYAVPAPESFDAP